MMKADPIINVPKITISEFIKKSAKVLDLTVLAGNAGLKIKQISSFRIQKIGLALAGFEQNVNEGCIQIISQSGISYLSQLSSEDRIKALLKLNLNKICCILITKNLVPPKELLELADEKKIPVIQTPNVSSQFISDATVFLQLELAPQKTIHGVLLGMYSIGVLILGESGIGKSECALDLILRGHRLISDDAVLIKRIGDVINGESPEITQEYIEIRGLGILNVREVFGVSAIGKSKQIELIIELRRWDQVSDVERLGLEIQEEDIFGIKLKKFVLPVNIGRNLSTLVETAVRLYLLRNEGINSAHELFEKHSEIVKKNKI
jgi:HPr kinase/phosphorylase